MKANSKKIARQRRSRKTRAKIKELKVHRLSVTRSPRHIYAQIFVHDGSSVVVSASTVDAVTKNNIKNGGNVAVATEVGKLIAERAKKAGITRVAFDRSGYKYHGRIKALADAARENGLQF